MGDAEGRPLKTVETLILLTLAPGDRHGYGIRQDILDQTGGETAIEAGALYRHLRTLEDDGLLAEVRAPRGERDERRIYYRLTPRGRRVLSGEMERLRTLVRHAEREGILSPSRA